MYAFTDRPPALAWRVEPDFPSLAGVRSDCVPDADLLPIRDPGDDAKDEMLRPLPKKETA
jgi:hypothetical protein